MKENIKSLIPYILILFVVILVKRYAFTTIKVNGISMEPTLKDKDIMILNKISYRLNGAKRFDIIVADIERAKIIKRVIGLPGEVIEYKDNKLYINGKEIEDKIKNIEIDNFKYTLNNREYFVMGDNRNNSLDSRVLGPIDKDQIMGKSSLTFYPLNRLGIKK